MFVREWVLRAAGPEELPVPRSHHHIAPAPVRDGRCSNPPDDGNSNERRENETNSAEPRRRDHADEENCGQKESDGVVIMRAFLLLP
jgi:hypothetical protein